MLYSYKAYNSPTDRIYHFPTPISPTKFISLFIIQENDLLKNKGEK